MTSRSSWRARLQRYAPGAPASATRPDTLTAEDVALLYEGALGRPPTPQEIEQQLAAGTGLGGLLRMVMASDERRAHESATAQEAAPPRHVVNVHTEELEPYGFEPGTWSDDGVAITGRRGWVFLGGGTNAILDQYCGAVELEPDFHARWAEAMAVRRAGAEALGAAFVGLIVPDKLPVLADEFPMPLPRAAEAPAAALAARPELGLLHPVAELATVSEGAYLRTDTHLTYAGNAALASVVAAALGVDVAFGPPAGPIHRYVTSGDLGSRFSPQIVEVVSGPSGWGAAHLAESNHDEIAAVGGHIGTRQVLRNDDAPDVRTIVIFGDSYAFAARHYQGLAWLMAQAFREVHFVWSPFGWDPDYAAAVGAGAIVCQGAERFAIRPPELRIDVAGLAAATHARLGGEPSPVAATLAPVDVEASQRAGLDWAQRFPPPVQPWSAEYVAAHTRLVGAALDDAALRTAAASSGPLPAGYGASFDERVVEYPWAFGQGLGGRVLDAGSTFNHQHIVDRALPLVDELTIVTLAPEERAFFDRGVSYVFADLRALPFRDGWFDMVVSLSTLEHVGKDNAIYGAEGTVADDPDVALAAAAQELRRVTRPGGRILFSVPYGAREDHGWFRQFDAEDLARLLEAFAAPRAAVSLFRHTPSGWQSCTADDAATLAYRDYQADPRPVEDGAAAARAVACVAIDL